MVEAEIRKRAELSDDFDKNDSILVTAGASTPGWIINNVLEKLYNIKFKKSNILLYSLKKILESIVRTNILSAVSAFFMTIAAMKVAGFGVDYTFSLLSLFYIFSMYTINNYLDRNFLKYSNPYKYKIYNIYGVSLLVIAIILIVSWILILSKLKNWIFKKELKF